VMVAIAGFSSTALRPLLLRVLFPQVPAQGAYPRAGGAGPECQHLGLIPRLFLRHLVDRVLDVGREVDRAGCADADTGRNIGWQSARHGRQPDRQIAGDLVVFPFCGSIWIR